MSSTPFQHFFDLSQDSPLARLHQELIALDAEKSPTAHCFVSISIIELLAQFYDGHLTQSKPAMKVRIFSAEIMQFQSKETSILLYFRNALVHGAGNHAFNAKTKRWYRFFVDFKTDNTFTQKGSSTYLVNPYLLKEQALKAIETYREMVVEQADLQKKFNDTYRLIGKRSFAG